MPPHCDSMDGPVVTVARKALETENVNLILPYVPKEGETEVIQAFKKVLPLHKQPNGAREVGPTCISSRRSSACTGRARARPIPA